MNTQVKKVCQLNEDLKRELEHHRREVESLRVQIRELTSYVKVTESITDQESLNNLVELAKKKIDLNDVLIYIHGSMIQRNEKRSKRYLQLLKLLNANLESYIRFHLDIVEIVRRGHHEYLSLINQKEGEAKSQLDLLFKNLAQLENELQVPSQL